MLDVQEQPPLFDNLPPNTVPFTGVIDFQYEFIASDEAVVHIKLDETVLEFRKAVMKLWRNPVLNTYDPYDPAKFTLPVDMT